MDERPDSKRFYNSPITAKPIQWRTGDFLELSYAGFIDYLDKAFSEKKKEKICENLPFSHEYTILLPNWKSQVITEKDLPTEFFNHDLMDVNTRDKKSVLDFCRKWGFPFHSFRFIDKEMSNLIKATPKFYDELGVSLLGAITVSDIAMAEAVKCLFDSPDALPCFQIKALSRSNRTPRDIYKAPVITLEEASFAIGFFQTQVRLLWHDIKEADQNKRSHTLQQRDYSYFFAPCSFFPLDISKVPINKEVCLPIGDNPIMRPSLRGTLTSAICNQILNTMADPTEWRTCKCEGCEVVFKHRYGQGNRRVHNDSVYCSQKCSERQKKRNQRAAAKNRIKH